MLDLTQETLCLVNQHGFFFFCPFMLYLLKRVKWVPVSVFINVEIFASISLPCDFTFTLYYTRVSTMVFSTCARAFTASRCIQLCYYSL